jgi:hypothetical protein
MSGEIADYLRGLPPAQAEELARVNGPGLAALEQYLASGEAVAFLGAGVSAPLYPLWDGLIMLLVEAASARLDEREAATLTVLAGQRPEVVVEIVRQQLGDAQYQEVLREVLRVRTDPESGRTWTPVQELVCRCGFKAVVTTNYDPGIVDARMAWDPAAEGNDPGILRRLAEIEYGARVVLYPAPGGDHSALARLLSGLADSRFPPAVDLPSPLEPQATGPGQQGNTDEARIPLAWVPAAEPVEHFTGRAEELARLDRWAADPGVALVGVTAWGGAGKTALVTHWVLEAGGLARRPDVRGVFGWSFYADPSAEHWARALLEWARQELGIVVVGTGRLAGAVLELLRVVPLLLVLDGLELVQEGPAGGEFGRLLDGTLREVLAGTCRQPCGGLVLLTSRFPFADLEGFDGGTARMLEVPPFTPAEGAALLAAAGGGWLAEPERRDLVAAVDGHALATGVLAGLLADRLPEDDLAGLRAGLAEATRTDTRVGRVLEFYAARLAEPDRYLLAAVSLFTRPVAADAVLTVASHEAFGGRLAGLASWHPDGTISAHPLVRDTFRRLVLDAAETAAETALAGMPAGKVTSRADALRVVEVIELLLDANQWQGADDMYRNRSERGVAWRNLPAARLGQRAAAAFVATPARRALCGSHLTSSRRSHYLNAPVCSR